MKRALRIVAGLLALVATLAMAGAVALHLNPYDTARLSEGHAESWRLLDRNGDLLRESVGSEGARAEWVPLEQLSGWVVAGTIATEDQRFWTHPGVDPIGVGRAIAQALTEGRVVSGASTLTMQLARLLEDHPRTGPGKLHQAWDALRIEASASKETVLEQYLNRAPYGAGTIGVEAASQRYFGKSSRNLSIAQAALIAGLPQAPTAHNPMLHPDSALRRRATVLRRMLERGFIDEEQHERARAEPLLLAEAASRPLAMHFTDEVLGSGVAPGEIRTTLDLGLQRQVEAMVHDHVMALREGGLTQAAVVVLDNRNCEVLSMVGSADYWGGAEGRNNGATALRQPGSALKPFTYALAFAGRYSPASIVADVPTRYPGGDGTLMHPQNYSQTFSGPVTMGDALGRSLNIPAVRVANAVGVDEVLSTLRGVGFTSFTEDVSHYGLGLTLGNGEVRLSELTQAYATFARKGETCDARLVIGPGTAAGAQVFSEQTAFLVTSVLSDERLRIRAFGSNNPLLLGFPVAVKTGTSSNWRDNWAVGYTDRYTVGVWTGDFMGRPMNHLSGAIGAGPLFNRVMTLLAGNNRAGETGRVPPEGVSQVLVCPLSGKLPGPHCPGTRALHVLDDQAPTEPCSWHQSIRLDQRNGLRASTKCPDEHVAQAVHEVLPSAYSEWQARYTATRPPSQYSPLCPADAITPDAVVITSPRNEDVFVVEPGYERATQTLELSVEIDPPVPEVTWVVDGSQVAAVTWPYTSVWPLQPGVHTVEVLAGERRSEPVQFEVW